MQSKATRPCPALRGAKVKTITRLWHVGTMNPADKGSDSHEGNGLSVSRHPEEWTRIARLGGGDTFELFRKSARFLDFHHLIPAARQELQDWGVANGWLVLETRWKAKWYDDESGDEVYMLCPTRDSALAEVEPRLEDEDDDPANSIEEVQVACLTDKAVERIGFKLEPVHGLDIAATFWVEDETDLDGVWWQDRLEPENYSAPRGVICLKQLPNWQVTLIKRAQTR